MKKWQTVACDRGAAERLAGAMGLPLPVALVLVARGLDTSEAAGRFLEPRLSDLSDPCDLPDMAGAVARIRRAIDEHQRIVVFGDYDVDGVTGTALLTRFLRRMGGNAEPFLPDRFEHGYGFTPAALSGCAAALSPQLLITVDCGTTAAETVGQAGRSGIDVIVTDHHEMGHTVPEAVAVVNPKRGTDPRVVDLAGVGVVFKLCHAYLKRAMTEGDERASQVDLRDWLDLVAVGTVADVAPLCHENRILVRHGLTRLNRKGSLGFSALADVARLVDEIDTYHIGFVIGPRLNAAGRMTHADAALKLLLTDDAAEARECAQYLDEANTERREAEAAVLAQATAQLDARFAPERDFGVVAMGRDWHEGIIGIVASRLCARHARPAVVMSLDGEGNGRGSCRSIEALDIMKVLHGCEDVLDSYGGHSMAAGLNVRKENVEAFIRRFNDACAAELRGRDLTPVMRVDAWLGGADMNDDLLRHTARAKPFGIGNPTPVWGLRNVVVKDRPRVVGGQHLKMTLESEGRRFPAIAFRMAEDALPEGAMDVLFQLQQNTYGGRCDLEMNVKDVRPHEPV